MRRGADDPRMQRPHDHPTSSALARLALRLRQRLLRWYEFGLYALLVAMALAVALPAEGEDEPVHCANARSSARVMTR
jgi:hypothetical protein